MTAAQRQYMEAVWRGRAQRLSKRPAGFQENTSPVMVLGIGKERYGIDLPDVAEVLPPVWPTPVPGAPAAFAGVINVHGEIRPVIDLRRLLGIEAEPHGGLARVILLRREGRELGVQVDTVEQIRWIVPGDLQAAGSVRPVTSRHLRESTSDLLMLLRTEALFAELDLPVQPMGVQPTAAQDLSAQPTGVTN